MCPQIVQSSHGLITTVCYWDTESQLSYVCPQIVQSTHGLLTTVGYQLGPDAPVTYALEGSVAIAGAAIRSVVSVLFSLLPAQQGCVCRCPELMLS